MANKYILGYFGTNVEDFENPNDLTDFKGDKEDAEFYSEEWCEVEAETLDEAKLKYHEQFKAWQKSNNH